MIPYCHSYVLSVVEIIKVLPCWDFRTSNGVNYPLIIVPYFTLFKSQRQLYSLMIQNSYSINIGRDIKFSISIKQTHLSFMLYVGWNGPKQQRRKVVLFIFSGSVKWTEIRLWFIYHLPQVSVGERVSQGEAERLWQKPSIFSVYKQPVCELGVRWRWKMKVLMVI